MEHLAKPLLCSSCGYGFSPMWTLKMSKAGSSSITLTTFTFFIGFPSSTDIFMIANIFLLADTLNPLRPFTRPFYYVNSKIVKSFRLPGGASGKKPARQCRNHRQCRFDPWVGRLPGGGNGNPLQYSCLGNPMQREAYSPWDRKESDTTVHTHTITQSSKMGVQ